MSESNIGEVHILIKPGEADGGKNRVEISTSFNQAELNLVLDNIKKMIIEGELSADGQ